MFITQGCIVAIESDKPLKNTARQFQSVNGKVIETQNKKKDLPFLTGLSSLTWLRYPKIRGLTKHHDTNVSIIVRLTK